MTAFNFNPTATGYEPANAYWLGQAAKLAYADATTVRQETAAWGFDTFHFFDSKETQAFLAANAQMTLLAFRGTEPTKMKDWMSDVDLDLVEFPGGKAHHGFVRALGQVWTDLRAKLAEAQGGGNKPLWITGHSLGAALAALAAARLRIEEKQPVHGLYTFGQPRVGNRALAKSFDQDLRPRTFRFVNNNDVVTRVPVPGLLMKYSHVGTPLYFDAHGVLRSGIPLWQKLLDGLHGRMHDLGKLGTDGINDHSMDLYLDRLSKNMDANPLS